MQWHVTPQAMRQWEKYTATIAAAAAAAEKQAAASGSDDASNVPAVPSAADGGAAGAGGRRQIQGGSHAVAAAGEPTQLVPGALPADLAGRHAKRQRVGGGTAARDEGSGAADGQGSAQDHSLVHDTVGCVVVDADGASSLHSSRIGRRFIHADAQLCSCRLCGPRHLASTHVHLQFFMGSPSASHQIWVLRIAAGRVAAGVSSGGIAMKADGRVGEAACFGAGCYAETSGVGDRCFP